MDKDTDMGGARQAFPLTSGSVVVGLASADKEDRARAYERLIAGYWKPVYKYIRLKHRRGNDDAKDLTQAFFAQLLEKDYLARFEPARARFRTYLRVCLDGFLGHEHEAAGRIKRGGAARVLSLDFDAAEDELRRFPPAAGDADVFEREWVRDLFTRAVEAARLHCREAGKETALALFEQYDLTEHADGARPTYRALAEEHGVPVTQVTNFLAYARRVFRDQVVGCLREA